MATLRFVLRTDKPAKNDLHSIELIYQQSGQRKYFRTKERLRAASWDAKAQRALYLDKKEAKKLLPDVSFNQLPSAKEIDEINLQLGSVRKNITDIENRFQLNKVVYSPLMVINALKSDRPTTTKVEAPSNQLFDFIDNYLTDHTATREKGSLSVYRSLKNHLQHFQQDKKIKVSFDAIDFKFFQTFQNYLITHRGLNNTTVAKQLSTIKTFLNYARMQGVKIDDRYKDFKIKKENLEVIALTNEEFETIYNFDLSASKRLDQVRDVFCFACATGLRFSDIAQLKHEHIKKEEIRLIVTKTKEQILIPLNPYSHAILAKYASLYKPLPVISNQRTNEYIHELCEKAGIDEEIEIVRFRGNKRETALYKKHELITVHTGRKTFCTLSLEKGMSAEEVMQISGHKDYKSFKRYVKITEQRTRIVMSKAWGVIEKLKAV